MKQLYGSKQNICDPTKGHYFVNKLQKNKNKIKNKIEFSALVECN